MFNEEGIGGEGGEGVLEKQTKMNRRRGVLACVYGMCVCSLFKKKC